MRFIRRVSLCVLFLCPALAGANTVDLGPEVLVENGGGVIQAVGYSMPSLADWNSDNLPDLIIGLADGRVVVHLNIGTTGTPVFDEGQYLQTGGVGLDVGARATPSFVDWNDDDRRDLVVGGYDGRIHVFINTGADTRGDVDRDQGLSNRHRRRRIPMNTLHGSDDI
ncbi:hypothetical protein H8E07_04120 [bacterium]|nr:hypothetical protein [bacterium]